MPHETSIARLAGAGAAEIAEEPLFQLGAPFFTRETWLLFAALLSTPMMSPTVTDVDTVASLPHW